MKTASSAPGNRGRITRILSAITGIILAVVFVIAFGLSTPAGARLLFRPLQIYRPVEPGRLAQLAAVPTPTAIVILSAGRRNFAPEFGMFRRQTVDSVSLERIRYGAFVARRTGLPVLVSGGLDPIPLADLLAGALMSDYAIQARWIESRSRNTAENAMFSAAILKKNGIRRVLLVTHAWHMRRAAAAFRANGLDVAPLATGFFAPNGADLWDDLFPTLSTLRLSGFAIHEWGGLIWYRLHYGY